MIRVQRLDRRTIHLAENLLRARQRVGKQLLSDEELEAAVVELHKSLENNRIVQYGAFNERDELMSQLTQVFSSQPYDHWLMSFLSTNPKLELGWDYRVNGLDALWNAAFVTGNVHKVPHAIWSLPKGWARTQEKTVRTSSVWKRHDVISFAEVPAGEVPTDPVLRWAFGDRPKTYDVVIRRSVPRGLAGLKQKLAAAQQP